MTVMQGVALVVSAESIIPTASEVVIAAPQILYILSLPGLIEMRFGSSSQHVLSMGEMDLVRLSTLAKGTEDRGNRVRGHVDITGSVLTTPKIVTQETTPGEGTGRSDTGYGAQAKYIGGRPDKMRTEDVDGI